MHNSVQNVNTTREASAAIGDDSEIERLGLIVVANVIGEFAFGGRGDEIADGLFDDAGRICGW